MEEFFYLSNPARTSISLYVRDKEKEAQIVKKHEKELRVKRSAMKLDRASRTLFKKVVFWPRQWESLNQAQINAQRRKFNLKFLSWAILNPSKVEGFCETDSQFIINTRNHLFFSSFVYFAALIFVNRFLSKLDPPVFYENYFQRGIMSTRGLRLGVVAGIGLFGAFKQYSGVADDVFLFDTGLKYKEIIKPGAFSDPKAESSLPKRQPVSESVSA